MVILAGMFTVGHDAQVIAQGTKEHPLNYMIFVTSSST
jgi:hypothetical protein